MPASGERRPWPFPRKGKEGALAPCHWLSPCRLPQACGDGCSQSILGAVTFPGGTGNEAFASASFPCKPRAREIAPPGLKYPKAKLADPHCGPAERLSRQVGHPSPPYLHAVQLLGQDAQEVIGEVAQQWRVPVPIAPLAGRGCGVQHIDAGGREATTRREQSGPDTGVPGPSHQDPARNGTPASRGLRCFHSQLCSHSGLEASKPLELSMHGACAGRSGFRRRCL